MKRLLIDSYRKLLYRITGLSRDSLAQDYERVFVGGAESDPAFDDVVHPCVIRLENKFLGSYWWMIYTPYLNYDSSVENPIICRASDYSRNVVPNSWERFKVVVDRPSKGYNSDPFLLFKDNSLMFGWRESHTPNADAFGAVRCLFVGGINERGEVYHNKTPVVREASASLDRTISPSLILKESGYGMYCMDLRLRRKIDHLFVNRFAKSILSFFDLTYVWRRIQCNGLALYEIDADLHSKGRYKRTIPFVNLHLLYQPWHHEMFLIKDELYVIALSNKENGDIIIGKYDQSLSAFKFSKRPVLTPESSNLLGLYKPSVVVFDDFISVFFTGQFPGKRGMNALFNTKVYLTDLL